ncbi:histidine kinase [Mangrovimonas sp. AS39]|uniref:tetratricopeptide repeat-containing sensor histidine kinase n=1 Tax=Mangrovimonas futianensis TaxID=2895523 RepID=UPI001E4376DF|nr:histidine kinase [Mangrovimonas futianensis]MCF1192919.1 histidine kinase [Mangrovimonas futianensis]MCF1196610.1 histidine kinase [Mangrovimonas futianensis]
MKREATYYIIIFFTFMNFYGFAQNRTDLNEVKQYEIKGQVRESDSKKAIKDVTVEILAGARTTTNQSGRFKIKAKEGDQLVISHDDFQTVYYVILNDDDIIVEVQPELNRKPNQRKSFEQYSRFLDSSKKYLKLDVEKGLQFATDALAESNSKEQNARAYELIADIYMHWKQYDLAVSNYRISLQNMSSLEVKLKLGRAYQLNKDLENSINTFLSINESQLSTYQQTILFEGLGDAYMDSRNYSKAIAVYKKGLQVAKAHLITPKIIDLNSKIANSYNESGEITIAEDYYDNSLNLASKENKERALKEKVTVADFQGSNQAYDEEIELRKEVLEDIKEVERDSIIDNDSPYTPQKQNYKIGNAFYLQKDYDSAINYLEKSIKQADTKSDLVVKKDATRKLSEVYNSSGNSEKALKTYQDYTELVEQLYVKKEQEIVRAAKFSRDIANQQNRIKSLESERELSESKYQLTTERNRNQQIVIYSLVFGMTLLIVVAYLMYKYIKQQRLANNLLALKSLRSQMNPHFIFNALNSVNSFIATNDERTANKYLSDFSTLMRAVLENSEEDFIPLEKEIELLELYTKLEHFRFQNKFDYSIEVDPKIKIDEFQIPPMLLQPYIENAVWHGLRYKEEKGWLQIDISYVNRNEIAITISDNGIGRERSKALKTQNQRKHNSKGLSNIQKRVVILNDMYKDKVDVQIEDINKGEETGTKVVVTIKKD